MENVLTSGFFWGSGIMSSLIPPLERSILMIEHIDSDDPATCLRNYGTEFSVSLSHCCVWNFLKSFPFGYVSV